MSRSLNRVLLIGHLGRDPELRSTSSGQPVTTFSLATTRSWHSPAGERHEETEWFQIVAWGSLAEICQQYLRRGQRVFIEGRLQTRRWEGAEGQKHLSVEIVAREMIMLGEPRDPLAGNPLVGGVSVGEFPPGEAPSGDDRE